MSESENRLILYYSFTGNTRRIAEELAQSEGGELIEFTDAKKHGNRWAFLVGCFSAMRMKGKPIAPLDVDFSAYDSVTLCSPIWAGHPPPAVNTVLGMLPKGTRLSLHFVSGGGQSAREKIVLHCRGLGLKVEAYVDTRAPAPGGGN